MERAARPADACLMQTISSRAHDHSGTTGAAEPLNVAIFYTDFAAGSLALRLFARLADCLHDDFLLKVTVWRLATPGATGVAQNAATAAALADVIVLGLHGGEALPFGVRRWMREVELRRAGRPGLVVKLVAADGALARGQACRADVANFSWVDFPAINPPPLGRMPECGGIARREKLARGLARAVAAER